MKTLRKVDIELMEQELSILRHPEKILGGDGLTIGGHYIGYGSTDCVLQTISFLSGQNINDIYGYAGQVVSEKYNISGQMGANLAGVGLQEDEIQQTFEHFMGDCVTTYFNPNCAPGEAAVTGSAGMILDRSGHAIAMTNYDGSGNFTYWDEQQQKSGTMTTSDIFALITDTGNITGAIGDDISGSLIP